MGLGKTLMSITLLWTLLNQGLTQNRQGQGQAAVRKVVVVCPTSLVGNWDNEIRKWVGEHCPTFAVKTDPKRVIKSFLQHRGKGVLIVSYETQRLYSKLFEAATKQQHQQAASGSRFSLGGGGAAGGAVGVSAVIAATANAPSDSGEDTAIDANTSTAVVAAPSSSNNYSIGGVPRGHSNNGICDLLICDEAHKLKNADSGLARSLSLLPAKKRILLSGTPMQNELTEFFNMVNFCNPGVLGSGADFKKR